MGTIANGLALAEYAPLGMGDVERALKFAKEHPEAGFPFVVYQIIERARGRAAADVLRGLSDEKPRASQAADSRARTISRLQTRLMSARMPAERQRLLDQLWEAEQRTKLQGSDQRVRLPIGKNRLDIRYA
jgi:hypothetical protein